jgi:hypothetical protein
MFTIQCQLIATFLFPRNRNENLVVFCLFVYKFISCHQTFVRAELLNRE